MCKQIKKGTKVFTNVHNYDKVSQIRVKCRLNKVDQTLRNYAEVNESVQKREH